jgi:hypothetical protein
MPCYSHDRDGRVGDPRGQLSGAMDPDNDLYDAACELLEAAQRFDHASRGDGLDGVVPGTIGCVESSLGALARAIEALQIVDGARRDRFEDLVRALQRAEAACRPARSTAVAQPDRR